jgi:hypothetical protein
LCGFRLATARLVGRHRDPGLRGLRCSVGFEREIPNASDLPEPAAEVLRRFDGLLRHGVQLVSTDEARTILDAVVEAGLAPPVIMNDYGIWFTLRGLSRPSVLHFNPEFPDFGPC